MSNLFTAQAADPDALRIAIDVGFEEFWHRYPRRPNDPKAKGRSSYARALGFATHTEIMAGLARYEFSPDPKFRPMVCTWLNQRRWECEVVDLSADPWGLREWLASLPDDGALSALSYEYDALVWIMLATGWPETWRGRLYTLGWWLRDGYTPASIAAVIASAVFARRRFTELAALDRTVRTLATQFSPASFGYR